MLGNVQNRQYGRYYSLLISVYIKVASKGSSSTAGLLTLLNLGGTIGSAEVGYSIRRLRRLKMVLVCGACLLFAAAIVIEVNWKGTVDLHSWHDCF
jgi:hypothetical protein